MPREAPAAQPPIAPKPEATRVPPAARVPSGEIMSEPCRLGVPPRIPARSFGVCQHKAAKMSDAPMIENESVAGCVELATLSALVNQVDDKVMPVLINRYRSMIFTPIETASEMYRSTYGDDHREPPNPKNTNAAATRM